MRNVLNHYVRGIKLGNATVLDGMLNYTVIEENCIYEQTFKKHEKLISELLLGDKNLKTYEYYRKAKKGKNHKNIDSWIMISKGENLLDCITLCDTIIGFYINSGMGTDYLILDGFEHYTPIENWQKNAIYQWDCFLDVMIEMRDGVKLSTDIFLPKRKSNLEKFPTIISRTPYGKTRLRDRDKLWAYYGYVVILQDVRGRDDSEGLFIGMYNEMNDGEDVLNWICRQDWSNGKVGSIGGSYGGYVQWAMAASGHKALKGIISLVTAGGPFSDIERYGGGYNMAILDWNIMMSEQRILLDIEQVKWPDKHEIMPLKEIHEKMGGKKVKFWDEYIKHPHYDEFWKEMTFSEKASKINVPALVVTGWHDGDIKGSVEVWEMNKKEKRKNQKLIIGPWVHKFNGSRLLGEYEFGKEATLTNLDYTYLMWFEKCLKNVKNAIRLSNAKIFIEGSNKWINLKEFPTSKSIQKLFLTKKTTGILTENLTDLPKEGYVSYMYDPQNPAPQLIDKDLKKPFLPVDYSKVEQREDIINFTTLKQEREIIILGQPRLTLYIATSAKDTDFVARLTRVEESGKSIRFAEAYMRCKYRNSLEKPELLEEGKIYELELKFPYCGISINKGEAIRLEITSAQYLEMFPNTNTGEDPIWDENYVIAKQKVYYGREYQSVLYLPIF